MSLSVEVECNHASPHHMTDPIESYNALQMDLELSSLVEAQTSLLKPDSGRPSLFKTMIRSPPTHNATKETTTMTTSFRLLLLRQVAVQVGALAALSRHLVSHAVNDSQPQPSRSRSRSLQLLMSPYAPQGLGQRFQHHPRPLDRSPLQFDPMSRWKHSRLRQTTENRWFQLRRQQTIPSVVTFHQMKI